MAEQWKETMDREMNSLDKNNTWTLVNKPILDVKWVYQRKLGDILKLGYWFEVSSKRTVLMIHIHLLLKCKL